MSATKKRRVAHLLSSGLSQQEAADVVGVTPRTLRRWKDEGALTTEGAENGNGNGEHSLSAARLRKEAALAEKHELDAELKRGELVDRSILEDVLLRIRSAVDSLPGRLSSDVATLLGIPRREALPLCEDVAAMVRREVRIELERLAAERAAAANAAPEPLPEEAPHFVYLRRAAIETLDELLDIEEDGRLETLPGIGPSRADDIREWIHERSG